MDRQSLKDLFKTRVLENKTNQKFPKTYDAWLENIIISLINVSKKKERDRIPKLNIVKFPLNEVKREITENGCNDMVHNLIFSTTKKTKGIEKDEFIFRRPGKESILG